MYANNAPEQNYKHFLTASMYCGSGLKKDLIVVVIVVLVLVVLVISILSNFSVFDRFVYIFE